MTTESNCNADELANELALSLQGDLAIVPDIDLTGSAYTFDVSQQTNNPLFDEPSDITIDDLTETTLNGDGVFDVMMRAVDTHINREYKSDRITGDQYAKVYEGALIAVLGNATSFLLSKDKNRFDAIQAQMEARKAQIMATSALVELETAKYQTAQIYYDMQNSGAKFALTKMQIANADAEHCMIKASTDKERYTVDKLMPVTLAQETHKLRCLLPAQTRFAEEQVEAQRAQTLDTRTDGLTPISGLLGLEVKTKQYNLDTLLPDEHDLKVNQIESSNKDTEIKDYNLTYTLPAQLAIIEEQREAERAKTSSTRSDGSTVITGLVGAQIRTAEADANTKDFMVDNTLPAQLDVLKEQYESERAKTLDTRTDNVTAIAGTVGKQKDLYSQQIESFKKDSRHKAAKMYLDGWITQKTLDEGLIAPTELTNATVDTVLEAVRLDNGLI